MIVELFGLIGKSALLCGGDRHDADSAGDDKRRRNGGCCNARAGGGSVLGEGRVG